VDGRSRVVAIALLVMLAGCAPRDGELLVFAAASIAAPVARIAAEFEQLHPGVRVQVHAAGTPQLVMQIREGAAADVFVAADERQMAFVSDNGRVFAQNRLAVAVPAGNPHRVAGLHDLAREDLVVALCAIDVPAGRYARMALARAGVTVRSVSDEPNVTALLTKLRLGEIDAAVVYETDVARAGGDITGIPIAAAHAVEARYPVAVLNERPLAGAFDEFLFTEPARRELRAAGFELP